MKSLKMNFCRVRSVSSQSVEVADSGVEVELEDRISLSLWKRTTTQGA